MNSGLRNGLRNHVRKNVGYIRPRYVGPLVFHPLTALTDIVAAGTATADVATSLTVDMSGSAGIPVDGSVVGLMVCILVRNSVVNTGTYVEIGDYDSLRKVGSVAAGDSVHFWQCYGGKVAGHYDNMNVDIVYTGGLNNTQFKYAISWGSGTVTYYLRCLGYWTAA